MNLRELKEYLKEVMQELDLHNHDDLVRYRCYQDVLSRIERTKE